MTLRSLVRMANARRRDAWNHTSQLLCILINSNRDPKKTQAVTAKSLHPFEVDNDEELTIEQMNRRLKDQIAKHHARGMANGGKTVKTKPFTPLSRKNGKRE